MLVDRRMALAALLAGPLAAQALERRTLVFPHDYGAHPDSNTEWWYLTGWLGADFGFQLTFFRSRPGVVAADHPSRFAARQLIFAHAALTDLRGQRLLHDQRVARAGFGIAQAREGDTDVTLRDWRLTRRDRPDGASLYRGVALSERAGFGLDLEFATAQPPLLQGDAGWSRKGPRPEQASCYYSRPQLEVRGRVTLDGAARDVHGRAWFDHEWSDAYLAAEAVGWDWLGMNLDDGSALTAFVLRRADGSALWAGGSWRDAQGRSRSYTPDEVQFEPGRRWTSPATQARYPVEWRLATPAGRFEVRALLDSQELDSRSSTGAVYWEGLSELRDAAGRVVGRGYLEMTGYAARLAM